MDSFSRFVLAASVAATFQIDAAVAAPQAQQVPVFDESIEVRVVNVETVVTDAKGNRVRGLTAQDFRLLVNGREVPIEYFTEVMEGTSVTADAAGPGAAPPVAAGEEVGRSYLVYIDEAFSLSSVRNEILERLERDLTLLQPGDRMAVLAFDGERMETLSGWTSDPGALAAALQLARQRDAGGSQMLAQQRKLQQDVDWIHDNANSLDDGDSAVSTIGAILRDMSMRISPEARTQLGKTALAAASALRGFEMPPGRKVMLWLSGAWTMSVAPRLYAPMVEAANRLGYTIYPVDAAKSDAREVSVLDLLARTTGGRVAVSARLEVFREVVEDTGSYYWLGFTPAWKADDRRHQVTVEPRRSGLRVRARTGFSDLSRRTENAIKAESVLLFGGAERNRRLIVQLGEPRRAGRGRLEIPVILGVPVESLTLTPQGQGFIAETPLAVAAMEGQGGRAELPTSRLRVSLKTPPRTGTFARFRTVLMLREAEQRLVFTVQDPLTGAAHWGEAELKLEQGRR